MRDDFLSESRNVYSFYSLTDIWNHRDRREWKKKELLYAQSLRSLAERVHVRYYDSSFWVYDGRIYVRVSDGEIKLAFSRFLEELYIPEMFLTGVGLRHFNLNFLEVIRYRNPLLPRFDIVAFENGILDMRDFTLHDFDAGYHCIEIKDFAYNANADCPMWKAFLHEVLPDSGSRAVLQMFLGLGLIERGSVFSSFANGKSAKVEVCLFLIGSGSNGKSVIQQTAMGIFGHNRISTADYDELTRPGDEGMRARRLLDGAVFNWSSESEAGGFGKRDAVFKKLVSGEPVTDRLIGGNVRQNYRIPYLVFNMNETPGGAAYALLRRLQVVQFGVQIPEERQNKTLAYELRGEYSGIFNWIARGSREITRRKYMFPATGGGLKQKLLMRLTQNPVIAWAEAYGLKNKGIEDEYVTAPAGVLYESMCRFCEDNNVEAPSKQFFGRTLGSGTKEHLGLSSKRKLDGTWYKFWGCPLDKLNEPILVEAEEYNASWDRGKDCFIREDD